MSQNPYDRIPKEFLDKEVKNPNFALHNFKLPFRAVVCAPSGAGKTSFIYNFIELLCKGKGTMHSIHIITQNSDEPLYRALREQNITITEGIRTIPKLDDFDKQYNHLVILDDLQLEKDQTKIVEYYIRCRKRNVSIMYLAQNYYSIPITVRNNANYAILLKIPSERDFKLMIKDFGSWNVNKDAIMNMYLFATREKFSPFIIDKEESDITHKFRKGFVTYLDPVDFVEDKDQTG
jgi:hypothetical protein